MTFLCMTAQTVACVAWRFCRAERRSGVATKTSRAKREKPISSRFLCPRPPLLLSSPNQNRHATQATQTGAHTFLPSFDNANGHLYQ